MDKIFSHSHTFKALKKHKQETRATLSEYTKKTLATLGSGSLSDAVILPKGEKKEEWLAVNTTDFFNEISTLYGNIQPFCTKDTCPVMSAGVSFQYRWADGVKVKKPISVSAPEYVEYLMAWVESQLNDEDIFPINYGSEYPKDFDKKVQTIFKRYFRVYAHIYHSHLKDVESIHATPHLNTCFKHFIYFVQYWKLVEPKELAPLEMVIKKLAPDLDTGLDKLEKSDKDKNEKKED